MGYFDNVISRCVASWEPTWKQLREREAAGAVWNAFDESPMGWRFLVGANVFYFVMLYTIYTAMKNRKPFSCSAFMKVYNLVCVLLAGSSAYYMACGKLIQTNFVCNANADGTEAGDLLMLGSKLFYAQKFWEFLDTFIFLLRKKSRQVTFLHIYHHSSITLAGAAYLTFDGNGDCYLSGLLNSAVHVLMYSHYFITSCGISSTPWKPYLTTCQLAQFVAIAAQPVIAWHYGYWCLYVGWYCVGLTLRPTCGFPDWLKIAMIAYMSSMLVLFGRFFVASYMPKRVKASNKKTQ